MKESFVRREQQRGGKERAALRQSYTGRLQRWVGLEACIVDVMCSRVADAFEGCSGWLVSCRAGKVIVRQAHGRGALAPSTSSVEAVNNPGFSGSSSHLDGRPCDQGVVREVSRDVAKSPRGASRVTIGHAWGVSPGQSQRMLMPAANKWWISPSSS